MQLDEKTIRSVLVEQDFVSPADMRRVQESAKRRKEPLVNALLSASVITKDLLGQAIAEWYKVPYADLNSRVPTREQIFSISEEIARRYRVVFFSRDGAAVCLTTDDPSQAGIRDACAKLFPNKKITFAYSLPEDIDHVLLQYQKSLETRFSKIIASKQRIAPEILEEIFDDAIAFRASDIHCEPTETDVVVRFRIDGVLHEAGHIPREHYESILNRIKVQSGLRIDEHVASQDGSIRYDTDGGAVDMRVSIAPTLGGEKIVLRVLSSYIKGLSFADLGFSSKDQEQIQETCIKPFGMILVAGPTGSGKTTTLYSMVQFLNQPDVNITTIEDPVEYRIPGVNQIQVNPQTNLTFAKGLRSIVRQDPDIILVGEIRDHETAEIAVNAALTGHLLFSTFHAIGGSAAIPRLFDMGIEPFLLASTLELIVAQRLVRKICEQCRQSVSMRGALGRAQKYFVGKKVLYAGKGCTSCSATGYKGRTAIFECIRMTPELQELLLRRPSAHEIEKLVRRHGFRTMFEDGVEKVKQGITTLDELMRVAPDS